jgi:ribonuclease HI
MKQVNLYTDGACSHNPGPGGYGVVLMYDAHRKELSGGFRRTTNNRMEILAAIVGLESLKEPCQVTLYSDSQYLVDSITKGWAIRWQAKGWMRNSKDKAINPDLWERLLKLCKIHKVQFQWVRGHAGHKENERCDELATAAVKGSGLAVDEVYEKTSP